MLEVSAKRWAFMYVVSVCAELYHVVQISDPFPFLSSVSAAGETDNKISSDLLDQQHTN